MLLKKEEKDAVITAIYESSNILGSTYNKVTNDLVLTFNKGNQYKYVGVTSNDYLRFEIAESQGRVFNSHIKNYKFEKLGTIDPQTLLAEVDELKLKEKQLLLEAKQLKLVEQMNVLMNNTNISYSLEQLKKLQSVVEEYINELNK